MRRIWVFAVLLIMSSVCLGQNWPQWRGPFLNGSAEIENLPTSWSETKNKAWELKLPGDGAATPIVWGDKLFLASTDSSYVKLLALCIDINSGKVIWQKEVSKVTFDSPNNGQRNTKATSSPITDGQHVYFLYGTGDMIAFDFAGKELWKRQLSKDYGNFDLMWGYGASPLLVDNTLFVPVLRRDQPWHPAPGDIEPHESMVLALDKATGKTLWKHKRETDAVNESQDSYTTPMVYQSKDRTDIIVFGGDYATGHSPETGEELWRFNYAPRKNRNWRLVPSPLVVDDLIMVIAPRGGQPMYALKAGGSGMLDSDEVVWTFDRDTPDVCTPLYYQGRIYVLDGVRKVISCLDPKTGRQIWQGELGRGPVYRASPTGADGKIYCVSEGGEVVVLAAGEEFKE
ncbi:MAG: PQQ-binding-like beta-propeller repeat protein, partial [Planctomycetes bacterium]|nr:PQQ-binding-like beta-propeller repeat protein [Planctomycetota bacterium]